MEIGGVGGVEGIRGAGGLDRASIQPMEPAASEPSGDGAARDMRRVATQLLGLRQSLDAVREAMGGRSLEESEFSGAADTRTPVADGRLEGEGRGQERSREVAGGGGDGFAGDAATDPLARVQAAVDLGGAEAAGALLQDLSGHGVNVAVDPAKDTLADVLERANELVSDLQATYNPQTVSLTFDDPAGDPELADDGVGSSGAVRAGSESSDSADEAPERTRVGARDPEGLPRELDDLFERLEEFLQVDVSGLAAGTLEDARGSVQQAVKEALQQAGLESAGERQTTSFGLSFDWSSPARPELQVDGNRLRGAVRSEAEDLLAFLNGESAREEAGLLSGLDAVLDNAVNTVVASLGAGSALGLKLNLLA